MTPSIDIFSNVASHKYLPLYDEKWNVVPRKVADFLKFENKDVAKLAGVSESSVRYDGKTKEIVHRLNEIANICELVAEHFEGDAAKTYLWFTMKNPLLGSISPRDMIRFGRYQKLMQFILDFKQGNIA